MSVRDDREPNGEPKRTASWPRALAWPGESHTPRTAIGDGDGSRRTLDPMNAPTPAAIRSSTARITTAAGLAQAAAAAATAPAAAPCKSARKAMLDCPGVSIRPSRAMRDHCIHAWHSSRGYRHRTARIECRFRHSSTARKRHVPARLRPRIQRASALHGTGRRARDARRGATPAQRQNETRERSDG